MKKNWFRFTRYSSQKILKRKGFKEKNENKKN